MERQRFRNDSKTSIVKNSRAYLKTIYLDLDGTLKSDVGAIPDNGITHTITENWRAEPFQYSFIERPRVREFLKKLDDAGYEIRLATMGWRSYAVQCLEAMGIRQFFNQLVCGLELRNPPKCSNFIIVDDRKDLADWKADQITHGDFAKVDHILVPTFYGGYDDELAKAFEKVQKITNLPKTDILGKIADYLKSTTNKA